MEIRWPYFLKNGKQGGPLEKLKEFESHERRRAKRMFNGQHGWEKKVTYVISSPGLFIKKKKDVEYGLSTGSCVCNGVTNTEAVLQECSSWQH